MKSYSSPELELVCFETEDVLTASFASLEDFKKACSQVDFVNSFEDCTGVWVCYVMTA